MLADKYTPITLERTTYVSDNTPQVYAAVPGLYTGFIQPVGGAEQFKNIKKGEDITDRMYTDLVTPAKYNDKVTQNGQVYYVIYSRQVKGISAVGHHKEILLKGSF